MSGRRTIKSKLVVSFVIAVGLSFLCTFLITFLIVRNDFNKVKEESISTIVNYGTANLTARIDEMFASAEAIAADDVIANPEVPLEDKIAKMDQYGEKLGLGGSLGYISEDGYLTSTDGYENDISQKQYCIDLFKEIPYISYPQFNTATGKQIIFIGVPRYYNGKLVGAMTCCFDSSVLSDLVADLSYIGEGHSYMISDTGLTISSDNIDDVLNNYNILEAAKEDSSLKGLADLHQTMIETEAGCLEFEGSYYFYDKVRNGVNWTLIFELPKSTFNSETINIATVFVASMIVTILIVIVISVIIGSALGKRMTKLNSRLKKIAKGDFTGSADEKESSKRDELGEIYLSLDQTHAQLKEDITTVVDISEDLNYQISNTLMDSDGNIIIDSNRLLHLSHKLEDLAAQYKL